MPAISSPHAIRAVKTLAPEILSTISSPHNSLFRECEINIKMHLPPAFSGGCIAGVDSQLRKQVLSYRSDVNGVLIAYWNIRLGQSMSRLIEDSADLHFTAQVSVLVFCPVEGSILVGKVNFISETHIGVVVFGVFNATISAVDMTPAFSFDVPSQCWRRANGMDEVTLGRKVKFVVTGLSHTSDVMFMTGSLKAKGGELLEADVVDVVSKDLLLNREISTVLAIGTTTPVSKSKIRFPHSDANTEQPDPKRLKKESTEKKKKKEKKDKKEKKEKKKSK